MPYVARLKKPVARNVPGGILLTPFLRLRQVWQALERPGTPTIAVRLVHQLEGRRYRRVMRIWLLATAVRVLRACM
jgi:hypothetical protein